MLQALRDPLRVFTDFAVQPVSYIVFTDGVRYYARNGSTGLIEYSDRDAAKVVQYAIDNTPLPGGTIFIKRGDYYLGGAVRITKFINLVGEGVNATKLILSPNANSRMIEYCIDPTLVSQLRFVNQHMYIAHLMLHGNADQQVSGTEAITTHAEGNCERVADWMMFDVWLHRYKGHGVRVRTTHNWVILHSSIEHNYGAAVYLDAADEGIVGFSLIYNNQHGVYVNNVWSSVRLIANRIAVFWGTAISIISSRFVIAVGNFIHAMEVRPIYYIYIYDSNRNLIADNAINVSVGAVADYGVYEDGLSDFNLFVNNILGNANIEPIRLVGSNSRAVNNYAIIGLGVPKPSAGSGVATIPAGSTRVTVSHGLYKAPSKVLVTPHGNARVWVENIGSTSFDIVTDVAPTADLRVAWYAEV
jgi:hypothetical protein